MASREAKGPFPVEKPAVPGPSSGDVWRVPLAVWRARRALDRGELERARELVSPLLGRFGSITFIRKLAAEILYASGDPLSAAMLFEQAAKKLPRDHAIAVGLVASYAALNRAGMTWVLRARGGSRPAPRRTRAQRSKGGAASGQCGSR